MKLVAIGDIHGCYETMQALINKVKAQYPNEELQFIFLGDYVDRGPNSRDVVQYLIDHPEHIVLMGNHEDMMVDSLCDTGRIENETHWFNNGGVATMNSYGWHVPKEHMEFLRGLQVIYNYGKWVFVHAGIDPTIEELENQNLIECLWSRKWNSVPVYDGGWKVVHGHTPITEGMPGTLFDQFNLDTACVFGYNLTAMVIDPATDKYEFVMETKVAADNIVGI